MSMMTTIARNTIAQIHELMENTTNEVTVKTIKTKSKESKLIANVEDGLITIKSEHGENVGLTFKSSFPIIDEDVTKMELFLASFINDHKRF